MMVLYIGMLVLYSGMLVLVNNGRYIKFYFINTIVDQTCVLVLLIKGGYIYNLYVIHDGPI